jgi:hypothetical protein
MSQVFRAYRDYIRRRQCVERLADVDERFFCAGGRVPPRQTAVTGRPRTEGIASCNFYRQPGPGPEDSSA